MYRLTEIAAQDFGAIYDYTLKEFGEEQADRYTDALEAFFDTLSGMPEIGRNYAAVPDVMRVEFQQHTIFYRVRDADILIARILHQQMNHLQHLR
ncbi:type II toxin-antitoxin system RelE/ParE family toxin [Enterobacteriaceae bacterium BIT-l23]|uniref:Toxin n=1 Tax=Jejubacter calystegiae TaxID=2579935 RepID=A0A4P8YK47_9ENTR|nr:type II toxin-antitoxin system RelE/ParE family toxin [Jejubacter calystegiae]NUU64980.1 type II toxin-antitoxin system RelE/ParE family toxin [Enterobacteriaceae bacterium BIT-l23]QCT20473.1 type II toxin-antitoxin system RelE/ParE family toxin [Jejubacter calystegiae]